MLCLKNQSFILNNFFIIKKILQNENATTNFNKSEFLIFLFMVKCHHLVSLLISMIDNLIFQINLLYFLYNSITLFEVNILSASSSSSSWLTNQI